MVNRDILPPRLSTYFILLEIKTPENVTEKDEKEYVHRYHHRRSWLSLCFPHVWEVGAVQLSTTTQAAPHGDSHTLEEGVVQTCGELKSTQIFVTWNFIMNNR